MQYAHVKHDPDSRRQQISAVFDGERPWHNVGSCQKGVVGFVVPAFAIRAWHGKFLKQVAEGKIYE